MTNRFAQLPIGAQFTLDDVTYRKVTPLEGERIDSSERRLIPRSTRIEALDEHAKSASPKRSTHWDRAAVEEAVAECMSTLQQRLRSQYPPIDKTQAATLSTLLKLAHEDLFNRIALRHRTEPRRPDDAAPTQ